METFNDEWKRLNKNTYTGKWIVLSDGKLISVQSSLQEVLEILYADYLVNHRVAFEVFLQ